MVGGAEKGKGQRRGRGQGREVRGAWTKMSSTSHVHTVLLSTVSFVRIGHVKGILLVYGMYSPLPPSPRRATHTEFGSELPPYCVLHNASLFEFSYCHLSFLFSPLTHTISPLSPSLRGGGKAGSCFFNPFFLAGFVGRRPGVGRTGQPAHRRRRQATRRQRPHRRSNRRQERVAQANVCVRVRMNVSQRRRRFGFVQTAGGGGGEGSGGLLAGERGDGFAGGTRRPAGDRNAAATAVLGGDGRLEGSFLQLGQLLKKR
jgi:hypothetical protein